MKISKIGKGGGKTGVSPCSVVSKIASQFWSNTRGFKEQSDILDILMGKEVLPRKQFIQTYAKEVKNLDI